MKCKNAIAFFILLSLDFTQMVYSQSLDWVRGFGGSGDDGNYDLVADDSSNVYITGWFSQTADVDPGAGVLQVTSSGDRDSYISKFDSQGNLIWSKKYGGSGQDEGSVITRDSLGNIIVAGRFSGTVDFDPEFTSYNLTSNGDRDVYVVKYTSGGTFIWAKSFGGPGYDDAERIRVDRLGNIIVVGSFTSNADLNPDISVVDIHSSNGSDDIYMLKMDANGGFIWVRTIGSAGSDDCAGLEVDDNNNYLISGYFSGSTNFGNLAYPLNLVPKGLSDIFFAKYSSQDSLVFCKNVGGTSNDISFDIKKKLDRIYICGYFNTIADFDPSANIQNLVSSGNADFFVAAYDTLGNFVWANSGGSVNFDFASCMSVFDDGTIILSGYSLGSININGFNGSINLSNHGNYDVFLALLNSAGDITNAYGIGGNGLDQSRFQTLDKNGNLFLAGVLGSSSVNFSLNSINNSPPFIGYNDSFLAKYSFCSDSLFVDGISGSNTVCEGDTVSYFAGVISDTINYNWEVPIGWQIVQENYNSLQVVAGHDSGIVSLHVFNHCLDDVASSVNVNVNPLSININNIIVCKNSSFTLPNGTTISLLSDTTLIEHYATINGCDSNIIFNVQVSNYVNLINNITLCSGASYSLNGNTYTSGGVYYDTIHVSNSCDSVIITNITMLPINLALNPQTVCENEPYVINSHSYNQSGVYLDTLQNIFGCDSIVITNLTVNSVDTSITLIPGGFISNQSNATYQWCECTINGPLPIPGKTDQTFLPDFLGTYSVIVSYNNCTDTSGCFNPTMVGLNTISSSNNIYANYNKDDHTVFVKSKTQINRVELFDLEGRIVYGNSEKAMEVKLSASELIKGLYILRVYSEVGATSLKILIQ